MDAETKFLKGALKRAKMRRALTSSNLTEDEGYVYSTLKQTLSKMAREDGDRQISPLDFGHIITLSKGFLSHLIDDPDSQLVAQCWARLFREFDDDYMFSTYGVSFGEMSVLTVEEPSRTCSEISPLRISGHDSHPAIGSASEYAYIKTHFGTPGPDYSPIVISWIEVGDAFFTTHKIEFASGETETIWFHCDYAGFDLPAELRTGNIGFRRPCHYSFSDRRVYGVQNQARSPEHLNRIITYFEMWHAYVTELVK